MIKISNSTTKLLPLANWKACSAHLSAASLTGVLPSLKHSASTGPYVAAWIISAAGLACHTTSKFIFCGVQLKSSVLQKVSSQIRTLATAFNEHKERLLTSLESSCIANMIEDRVSKWAELLEGSLRIWWSKSFPSALVDVSRTGNYMEYKHQTYTTKYRKETIISKEVSRF